MTPGICANEEGRQVRELKEKEGQNWLMIGFVNDGWIEKLGQMGLEVGVIVLYSCLSIDCMCRVFAEGGGYPLGCGYLIMWSLKVMLAALLFRDMVLFC